MPKCGVLAGTFKGIVSSLEASCRNVWEKNHVESSRFFRHRHFRVCFAGLLSGGLEKPVWKRAVLFGRGIALPNLFHGKTAAFRTDTDVKIPDGFEKFRHGHASITLPEPLVALELENDFQIPRFHTVVQFKMTYEEST